MRLLFYLQHINKNAQYIPDFIVSKKNSYKFRCFNISSSVSSSVITKLHANYEEYVVH